MRCRSTLGDGRLERRYDRGMLCVLLAVTFAQAEPVPATEPAAARKEAATPGKEAATPAKEAAPAPKKAYSDLEASEAIAAWKRVPAKAPLADRVAAIDTMVAGLHPTLVPVLDKLVRAPEAMVLRKKAAEALAWQPEKKAYPVVVNLLNDAGIARTVELAEPLVHALSRVGYEAKNWKTLESLFRVGYAANRIGLQRAIIKLAGEHKEPQALHVLLDNFDEPVPEDVHGASNPPAEYWEARWKAWKTWREDVKTAVQNITGHKFASKAEARAWLRVNGAKIGAKGF
jgi:hypothetical protein